ncbi:MAG: DEAD/DEAH box helicase [Armatimonadota bacterium]|nr:DEAD/DEAH box helicase [Armatimonadota bacterium]
MQPLFTHQQRALDFLVDKPGAVITAGLGTGKTRIVIEDAKRLGAQLFVVCPKSAIPVWEAQLGLWDPERRVRVLGVMNYEQVWRRPVAVPPRTMLVADEAHRLKDRTTKQSRTMRKLARAATWRRALTGTPVLNGVQDLWALYDFVAPGLLGPWRQFAQDHLLFHPLFSSKVVAARNLDALRTRIEPLTFHVAADEVLDLPPETNLYRGCELPPEARRAYAQVEQDLYAELEGVVIDAPNALVKILRLAQIAGGFGPSGEPLHTAKLRLLAEVLDEIGDEPVVIFCRFRPESAAICDLLADRGCPVGVITGATPTEQRASALRLFHEGRIRAMVCNIQAGSAAIDLTPARYAIYYSVGFSFGDYEQSRGRIRRYGQTRPQFYVHLQAWSTIDLDIWQALAAKAGVHAAVQAWWDRRP